MDALQDALVLSCGLPFHPPATPGSYCFWVSLFFDVAEGHCEHSGPRSRSKRTLSISDRTQQISLDESGFVPGGRYKRPEDGTEKEATGWLLKEDTRL